MTRREMMIAALGAASAPLLKAADAPSTFRVYSLFKETALTAAAEVMTLQLPANSARDIRLVGASMFTKDAAATVTLEVSGTAATATSLASVKINPKADTALGLGFSGSNVGTGTTVKKYDIAVGNESSIVFPEQYMQLARNVASVQNVTLRTNSVTSTVRLFIMWAEYV